MPKIQYVLGTLLLWTMSACAPGTTSDGKLIVSPTPLSKDEAAVAVNEVYGATATAIAKSHSQASVRAAADGVKTVNCEKGGTAQVEARLTTAADSRQSYTVTFAACDSGVFKLDGSITYDLTSTVNVAAAAVPEVGDINLSGDISVKLNGEITYTKGAKTHLIKHDNVEIQVKLDTGCVVISGAVSADSEDLSLNQSFCRNG